MACNPNDSSLLSALLLLAILGAESNRYSKPLETMKTKAIPSLRFDLEQ
jgi:hypothetical protein